VLQLKQLLDQIEAELRRLSHELRPTILDDLGPGPAVEFLAQKISKRSSLPIAVERFEGQRLPDVIETALYRVVQEALNNVTKHARAKLAKVQIRRGPKAIECWVHDDGVGFDPHAVLSGTTAGGLGVAGMRERINAVGGSFKIDSSPGGGTDLNITIPLED